MSSKPTTGDRLLPLPPLHPLRTFHAAARFGRYRDAAAALGLSESAVSHQVRKLEAYLGVQLFEREGAGVRLSAVGQVYFDQIDPAFARIRKATDDLSGPCCRVSLTLPSSLATHWLIPRLGQLEAACPEVNLQIVSTARLCDLRREQIDLAIRYGDGDWPGHEVRHLFDEQMFPVCRPGFLSAAAQADAQTAISSNRLLVGALHTEEWREWASARSLDPPSLQGALVLESASQLLEAAAEGLGLALGRRPLVDPYLRDGRVVAPFGAADRSGCSYFLVYPDDIELSVPARRVARWLTATADAGAPA